MSPKNTKINNYITIFEFYKIEAFIKIKDNSKAGRRYLQNM